MSNRAVTIAGIAVGIAIVTYVVLNVVAPFKQHEENLPQGAKVEDVFAGDVASTAAPNAAPAAAEPAAASAAPAAEATASPTASSEAPAPTEVAVAAPVAPASAPAAAADVPDIATPPDNSAPPKPAIEAPPSADAPKGDSVEIEGAEDFPMPDDSPSSTSASAPEPAAEPAPAAASAEPAVAAEPAAAPAAKPKPAAPKAAAVAKSAPRAEVLTQWWPQRPEPGRLNLLYAGQAANERTVGLLFDTRFAENADIGAGVRLVADNGKPAAGHWELNSNRRMLLFKGLKPGRYTVVVSPQLANEAGLAIGSELHGPVYIR